MEQQQSDARVGRCAFISAALILVVLMIAAGILTRLVPAGQYQRTVQDGREVLDPTSFSLTQARPLPVWRWFTAPVEVLGSSDAASEAIADKIRRLWREACCPSEPSWEEHAHRDALRAFGGVLHDQGLIS
jgi:hypothetical protein